MLTGLLADMLDAGSKGREKAIGLIALMYGALSLARAVAGTRLSDESAGGEKTLRASASRGIEMRGARRWGRRAETGGSAPV